MPPHIFPSLKILVLQSLSGLAFFISYYSVSYITIYSTALLSPLVCLLTQSDLSNQLFRQITLAASKTPATTMATLACLTVHIAALTDSAAQATVTV